MGRVGHNPLPISNIRDNAALDGPLVSLCLLGLFICKSFMKLDLYGLEYLEGSLKNRPSREK